MFLQQPGYHKCQVGAQRLVIIGNGSFVDQLEGLDDEQLLVYASCLNPHCPTYLIWSQKHGSSKRALCSYI